jgi:hypothetical protein
VTWEPSARADEFGGCRFCVHYERGGRCVAFPRRIPLPIFASDIDHMVPRPGQVGDTVFEPLDLQWYVKTGQRRPLSVGASAEAR